MMGIKLYAALGLLAVLIGLAGWGYIEHQRAQIAEGHVVVAQQETKAVAKERDDLAAQLAQSEADKAELAKQAAALDQTLVEQQKRAQELEHEKAQVWEQFDKLVKSQPKADQDCLTRPLPPEVLSFLRDEAPSVATPGLVNSGNVDSRSPSDTGRGFGSGPNFTH